MSKEEILTRREYNLLVKAGYQLEPYDELCVVKYPEGFFYREEYERMLRTAKQILER
jgi:hypothetical protein